MAILTGLGVQEMGGSRTVFETVLDEGSIAESGIEFIAQSVGKPE